MNTNLESNKTNSNFKYQVITNTQTLEGLGEISPSSQQACGTNKPQARAEGRPHGRPPTARNKESEVWSLSEAGLKPGKIAKKLGISRTSVRRILANANP